MAIGRVPVGVFHPGTQHSWQTALALDRLSRLAWYATSIYYQPDRFPYRAAQWLPGDRGRQVEAKLARFRHPQLNPAKVRTAGLLEWLERIAGNLGARKLAIRLDELGNRRFVQSLASDIRGAEPFALWGYNGSSLETFALGRSAGRACILDRTNGDWRAYNAAMEDVAEHYGDWFIDQERRVPERQIARDDAEYELADAIVCGSEFAAETVREQAPSVAARVRVLNYGYDDRLFGNLPAPRLVPRTRPVRFLFVGLAIPRKGIHHVLEAIAALPRAAAELTVCGQLGIPNPILARYANRVRFVPTVARAEVPSIMARHDVLVLPSYFEGSAVTLLEALAAGMAVIQTAQAGNGADADTGIVLDRPDTDTLREAMLIAIDDRDRLDHWRASAQRRARRFGFAAYRDNIAALLDDLRL